MTAHSPPSMSANGREFAFTEEDFQAIATFAHETFGLHFEPVKKNLMYTRLSKRLKQLGMADFATYRAHLFGPNGGDEQIAMLSSLTTNVTQFFREQHHFDYLAQHVWPDLVARARAGARVRLWSAGCSSGQEPYSLAIALSEACPEVARLNVKILATDIDPQIVSKAKAGKYLPLEADGLNASQKATYCTENDNGLVEVGPDLKSLITFGTLNLVGDWPMSGPFDVLFCRNVAIYFDQPTQSRLWGRFEKLLGPGAHLMIGHSERLSGPAEAALTSVAMTTFQKVMRA